MRLIGLEDPESRPDLEYAQLARERREAQAREEDRIMYVAMTRARERLLLSGAVDFAGWPRERPGAAPIAWLGSALVPELPVLCAMLCEPASCRPTISRARIERSRKRAKILRSRPSLPPQSRTRPSPQSPHPARADGGRHRRGAGLPAEHPPARLDARCEPIRRARPRVYIARPRVYIARPRVDIGGQAVDTVGMPRSMWIGTLSFGLVSVPVKLYAAVTSKTVHFNQLHGADNGRIYQKRVCSADGEDVPLRGDRQGL